MTMLCRRIVVLAWLFSQTDRVFVGRTWTTSDPCLDVVVVVATRILLSFRVVVVVVVVDAAATIDWKV
jgi:hypothetical protein